MASFLEDITPFYGTGERNGKGQTLEEFLEEYDPYRYKNPCCTTDTVVFSYKDEQALKEGRLKILLVKRGNHPSIGCWALPGGFVNLRENLEDTARRELQEETGVSGLPVEQFACYGDYQRDPRARIITSAYLSIVKESDVSVEAGDDAADAAWFEIEIDAVSPGAVTLLVYVFFDVVAELREVPIYGSRAVGMGDVDGASIAARRDGDA